MSTLTIYHNPRCSKSRQTLELIHQANANVNIVEYLKDAPSAETLHDILTKLNVPVRSMMRIKEAEYKEQNLADESLSVDDLITAMVNTPKLMERPIVVKGEQACIGRPPENVLELLK